MWVHLSPHVENEEYEVSPGKKNDGDEDALATLVEMERLGWLKKDAQEHRPNRQHVCNLPAILAQPLHPDRCSSDLHLPSTPPQGSLFLVRAGF